MIGGAQDAADGHAGCPPMLYDPHPVGGHLSKLVVHELREGELIKKSSAKRSQKDVEYRNGKALNI
jgi:hypothetical protein